MRPLPAHASQADTVGIAVKGLRLTSFDLERISCHWLRS